MIMYTTFYIEKLENQSSYNVQLVPYSSTNRMYRKDGAVSE